MTRIEDLSGYPSLPRTRSREVTPVDTKHEWYRLTDDKAIQVERVFSGGYSWEGGRGNIIADSETPGLVSDFSNPTESILSYFSRARRGSDPYGFDTR